ncbi:hypothetical protein RHRU231_750157 [Rhodococcus ruber]|uniref:Uncharacterized protein n=1 Tax=Rhodococcus ruber TaxID=1830 RepID=A0A098BRH0_9NOCA|nr:hypothetical protein RHRU231_750157 [Rhodococcus ruber]
MGARRSDRAGTARSLRALTRAPSSPRQRHPPVEQPEPVPLRPGLLMLRGRPLRGRLRLLLLVLHRGRLGARGAGAHRRQRDRPGRRDLAQLRVQNLHDFAVLSSGARRFPARRTTRHRLAQPAAGSGNPDVRLRIRDARPRWPPRTP